MPWYVLVLFIGSVIISSIGCVIDNDIVGKQLQYIGFTLLAVLVGIIAIKTYGF